MEIPYYIVDAFVLEKDYLFTGNPAAVCILNSHDQVSDAIKQNIAKEINLSETAFVDYKKDPKDEITIRWFTPTNEVDLCGHATIASAKALLHYMRDSSESNENIKEITFKTKSKSILKAKVNEFDEAIILDFPSNPPTRFEYHNTFRAWMIELIQFTLGPSVNANKVEDLQYSSGTKKLLIRLEQDSEALEGCDVPPTIKLIKPNYEKMLGLIANYLVRGVIVTMKGSQDGKPHFYSRYFSPWNGIPEDPVTGSAHTVLCPYWEDQLNVRGKLLMAKQCSDRGGKLFCKRNDDRVELSGNACIFSKGLIRI